MIKNVLSHIDWNKITDFLAQNANSQKGKQRLFNLAPLADKNQAIESFKNIEMAADLLRFHGNRPQFDSLDDIGICLLRIEKKAKLDCIELVKIRRFLQEILYLKRILKDVQNPWCLKILDQLMDPSNILSSIDKLVTSDGEIRIDASETLAKCFHEKNALKNGIHKLLERLIKQHELETVLQERFVTTRDGRWVLPVKNGMQSKFDGIIHDTSQSKQTVFMEPQEVVKNNNRIKELDILIEKEIDRLLRDISEKIHLSHGELVSMETIMVDLDCEFSKAKLKNKTNANPIRFQDESIFLPALSNPILEIESVDRKVIKNRVEFKQDQRLILLSGPNAGGKSILLKSLGLAAHMARCGLCVCASPDASIPFFKDLFLSIGDAQNITEGLSSFAGHMKELDIASRNANQLSLVLVDEICASTDPEEGSALARAFLDQFIENKSFCLISSHFSNLKQNWRKDEAILFASMEFDQETGLPAYRLVPGISGSSYAIKTAKRIGISANILNASIGYLSPESIERENKLHDLDQLRDQLMKAQKQLDHEIEQSLQQKNKYKDLIEKFKQERDRKLNQSIRRAEEKIDRELEKARQDRTISAFDLKADLPNIVKRREEVKIQSPEDFNREIKPGTHVYATNIQLNAIVQGLCNDKGFVEVLANSMKVSIPFQYLQLREEQKEKPKFKSALGDFSRSESGDTIDLRGCTSEEALRRIDAFCDKALLQGIDRVKIIHGHGTQVLKKTIRFHLAKSKYVDKWLSGGEYEGGDGLTWVYLR